MKFKTKATFLISGEIHDEDFAINDIFYTNLCFKHKNILLKMLNI